MQRRRFDTRGAIVNSLEGFPDAMRRVARQEGVALIDLTAMSQRFFEALGPEGSKRAFVHYPAGTFPGQAADLKDDTHFNAYGAYELARAVVEGIRSAGLGLASQGRARRRPIRPRPSRFAGHLEPAGEPEFQGRRRDGASPAGRARSPGAVHRRRLHRAERHAGAARVGHGDRALLRRDEDPGGEPRARRAQQPHLPDRGALGSGAERDDARRLPADSVRPQRRRIPQYGPGARLASGCG